MKKLMFTILLIALVSMIQAEPIRIACVGNSITSGSGNPKTDLDTYPAQLQVLMGEEYDTQNFGVSGRTMLKNGDYPLWNEPAFSEALEFKPNIVTIMLGTNDSKPQCWQYKDEFIPDYIAMIDTFRSLESNPEIHLCLPPRAFSVQWNIRDSVITTDIIPMIQQIAAGENTPVIDFYAPFEDRNDLFPDDIHPSKEGCWEFAKIFYAHFLQNEVQEIRDVNLALHKGVLTSKSSVLPDYLVDGNQATIWPCNKGESVTIDLGATESVDMIQMIFNAAGNYRYKVETSNDNTNWETAIDQSDRQDTINVAAESIAPVDAQFLRFTFDSADNALESIQIAELRILKTAPVHAPLVLYEISRVTSRSARFDLKIATSIPGGYLKYYYAYSDSDAYNCGKGYRKEDELTTSVNVRTDAERYYYAKFYKDGYEVASDTLKLVYALSALEDKTKPQPNQYRLHQNFPNPFNPDTEIHYELGQSAPVKLAIYDCLGREVETVVEQFQKAGAYSVQLNSQHLASGVYFYMLQANDWQMTRKMLLLK